MAKKYVTMGAGWLKENKSGEQYVSAVSGGEKSKTKLFLQLEDGSTHEVTTFAMFFNKNKTKPQFPDVQFSTTIDE